jgi:2-oxoglutarate ferredoxin oxidoreductase subunit delta
MAVSSPTVTTTAAHRLLPPEWVPLAIAADHCKACELCILACPHDALALDRATVNPLGYHPIALVAPERCTSCAFCARVCPDAVFTIYAPRKVAP